jgi:hypothetical protein
MPVSHYKTSCRNQNETIPVLAILYIECEGRHLSRIGFEEFPGIQTAETDP